MLRSLALALTVLTGFSALVYEVAWQRWLATLLGSSSEATATLLGLFLGGLALGYSLFGAVTRRLTASVGAPGAEAGALLRLYGIMEAAIGVYALVFPLAFGLVRALSIAIPVGAGATSFVIDVFLSALLIVPPAVLMGGTIPMLTQALARGLLDATRFHALVYGFNTFGAFAGALSAGFWLIPLLGLVGVLQAMSIINLICGGIFFVLGRRMQLVAQDSPVDPSSHGSSTSIAGLRSYIAAALLTGFAMMTLQTALIRVAGLSLGASNFTFSMVVAVFVLCIAIGSLVVSMAGKIPPWVLVANQWALLGMAICLYLFIPDMPYWAHVLRSLFRDQTAGFHPFHLLAFLGVLVAIGPCVAASGASLPLIFDHLKREAGDLGSSAGTLYSWNTVGSLIGALLGGYAFFFVLDLSAIFAIALGALALAAAALTAQVFASSGRIVAGVLLLTSLGGIGSLPSWTPEDFALGLFRRRAPNPMSYEGPERYRADRAEQSAKMELEILYYNDDPTSTVAVSRRRDADGELHHNLLINGKSDGAIPGDDVTTVLLGAIPAILAEPAKRAFVIGFGAGVTAGELAQLESVEEIIVAEISPGVIEAATHFETMNGAPLANEKIQITRGDAYRVLLRSSGEFDMIISEPSNPWVNGVEMLYSEEFLRVASERLAPAGVYGQWLHAYETDDATIGLILNTYRQVFEHVMIWYSMRKDFLLLGINDPETALDIERFLDRSQQPDIARMLERAKVTSTEALMAHEFLPSTAVAGLESGAEIHTLIHPRLSHAAARAFFIGAFGAMPAASSVRGGTQDALVQRFLSHRGGWPSDSSRAKYVEEVCTYRLKRCSALLAHWLYEDADSEALDSVLNAVRRMRDGAQKTNGRRLRALASLYQMPPEEPPSTEDLKKAERATDFFANYFHEGAPFSRDVLRAYWDRCARTPEQEEACAVRRRDAVKKVGGF